MASLLCYIQVCFPFGMDLSFPQVLFPSIKFFLALFFVSLMQSFSELEQDELNPYLQQSSSNNLTTGFAGISISMTYTAHYQ